MWSAFWEVDISHWEHSTSVEDSDLVGIDSIVLPLSTVNGIHIETMNKDESDIFFLAQISNPIPGESTFD